MKVRVYHGAPRPFEEFRLDQVQMGFWFSSDPARVARGESGAASARWLARCELDLRRVAGWEEYERLALDQIEAEGYDGVRLDGDWLVFDPDRVTVLSWRRREARGKRGRGGRE